MPNRRFRKGPERQVDAGLEAVPATLLHHLEPELAEAESCLVVTEQQAQHVGHRCVGVARCVAVAMLQAERHHSADDQCAQVLVGEQRWRHERGEDIHCRACDRIGHWRQVKQRFDRTVAELLPYPRVFLPDLVFRRMRRPSDAHAAQVVEADRDGPVASA
jgi:hypothetical protein